MTGFASDFGALVEQMAPIWIELSFFVFFGLGFLFLRLDRWSKGGKKAKSKIVDEPEVTCDDAATRRAIEQEAERGNSKGVLAVWRNVSSVWPTPTYLLRAVMQAFLDESSKTMTDEIIRHMSTHSVMMCNTRTAAVVLEVVARAGNVLVMGQLWNEMQVKLDIASGMPVYEVLLGGFAAKGDHERVAELVSEIRSRHLNLNARSYCVVIKGFLKHNRIDDCLDKLCEMQAHIPQVPAFAVAQLFRIAGEAGRLDEIFDKAVEGNLEIPQEAAAIILEECQKKGNLRLVQKLELVLRQSTDGLTPRDFEGLVKIYAQQSDQHALTLFQEMMDAGIRISEGLCTGILARCAESKFLRLAEEVVAHWRSKEPMTVQLYSSFMKVYAYSNMYNEACDLYPQMLSEGLQPDGIMYSCLMKFAAECGRTALSQELAEMLPNLDVQNFMSLMRSAVRDRDAPRAVALFRRWQASDVPVDVAAWNCCLDACISAGQIKTGRALFDEMVNTIAADIITYNTLLKGYCQAGDIDGAKLLMREMEAGGLHPNDVTYNCLINASVTFGSFEQAWEVIDTMKKNNVAPDHYTIAIMMKSLKKVTSPRKVSQTLALIESSGVDVFSDEIMLNTVLETCIRHNESSRLEKILDGFLKCGLKPSTHTFASLIKAAGILKWPEQCWKLWNEMAVRGLEPNDIVLGCMLNGLVSTGRIDEAVDLFRKTKEKIPGNTVLYSTLIKGFANSHRAADAMEIWREMRRDAVKMNVVVYNALIDAHARMGLMKEVSELVEAMEPDGCQPDHITYSTIVKGYCVAGDLDKAMSVFRGSQQHVSDAASPSVIFNTILDGCVRTNRHDLADQLIEELESLGVTPSTFTLSILIKMYGRRRQLEKAFQAMTELPKKYSFSCGAQVWTCLMCVCINNQALDRAFTVFDQIRELPGGADGKAFTSLILGCIRHGNLDAASKLAEEAYGLSDSSKPWHKHRQSQAAEGIDAEAMVQLMRALTQKDLMGTRGSSLLNKLEEKNPRLCATVKSSLLGSERHGRHSEAHGPRSRRS